MAQEAPKQEAQEAQGGDVPDNILKIINSMEFEDIDENALKVTSVRFLEAARLALYKPLCDALAGADTVLSVECEPAEGQEEIKEEDKVLFEKIVALKNNNTEVEIAEMEEKVTMEDLSPSELVEYAFSAEGPFMLAPMSLPSLAAYKKMKFADWKQKIEHPDCEAMFRRLLQMGLITNMFDHMSFASPESEKDEWIVQDEHGRNVIIPRPVAALRVWDVKSRAYAAVDPHLDGAPTAEEAPKFWNDMIAKFKAEQGEDYINGLMEKGKVKK